MVKRLVEENDVIRVGRQRDRIEVRGEVSNPPAQIRLYGGTAGCVEAAQSAVEGIDPTADAERDDRSLQISVSASDAEASLEDAVGVAGLEPVERPESVSAGDGAIDVEPHIEVGHPALIATNIRLELLIPEITCIANV